MAVREIDREIGSRLRRARENLDISIQEAAERLEYNVDTLEGWESGEAPDMTTDQGDVVMDLYRFSLDSLTLQNDEEQFDEDLILAHYRRLGASQQKSAAASFKTICASLAGS